MVVIEINLCLQKAGNLKYLLDLLGYCNQNP